MSEEHANKYDKEYDAFQIFEHIQFHEEAEMRKSPEDGTENEEPEAYSGGSVRRAGGSAIMPAEDSYYEIEYDSCPLPAEDREKGLYGEFFTKPPDIIQQPPRDEIRELFNRMRDIARENRQLNFTRPKFYDKRIQQENGKILYKQGMFMKDFEDDYEKIVPYSAYFPSYQMMGYDQLRTYFTWRTRIREGNVSHISLAYTFLYLYELLNNIGVEDPEDGLEKLLFFWETFREYDKSVDKYVPGWLKDYYIYYGLPGSFREFAAENGLEAYYPELAQAEDRFGLLCSLSKYDIRESSFYTEEREDLIRRCFAFTMERLKEILEGSNIVLEDYFFQPARNMTPWSPFQGALFYPAVRQPDRKVVLSEREVYLCSGNQWTFSKVITAESGKRLLAYVMKQMEASLRQRTGYKYKLAANIHILSPTMEAELKKAGIDLKKIIEDSVAAFYKEETKTVVRVDPGTLEKIRRESYAIQEKLIVPEEEILPLWQTEQAGEENPPVYERKDGETGVPDGAGIPRGIDVLKERERSGGEEQTREQAEFLAALERQETQETWEQAENPTARERQRTQETWNPPGAPAMPEQKGIQAVQEQSEISAIQGRQETSAPQPAENDQWKALREALTETEAKALYIILNGETDLKQFADRQGVMLEILAEGINEKAADIIGDALLDNEFEIYEDYLEEVKEVLLHSVFLQS